MIENTWEYKAVTIKRGGVFKLTETPSDEEATAALNREGALGWELVAVTYRPMEAPIFYFKRAR